VETHRVGPTVVVLTQESQRHTTHAARTLPVNCLAVKINETSSICNGLKEIPQYYNKESKIKTFVKNLLSNSQLPIAEKVWNALP